MPIRSVLVGHGWSLPPNDQADILDWADSGNENAFVWHKNPHEILERLAGHCTIINRDAHDPVFIALPTGPTLPRDGGSGATRVRLEPDPAGREPPATSHDELTTVPDLQEHGQKAEAADACRHRRRGLLSSDTPGYLGGVSGPPARLPGRLHRRPRQARDRPPAAHQRARTLLDFQPWGGHPRAPGQAGWYSCVGVPGSLVGRSSCLSIRRLPMASAEVSPVVALDVSVASQAVRAACANSPARVKPSWLCCRVEHGAGWRPGHSPGRGPLDGPPGLGDRYGHGRSAADRLRRVTTDAMSAKAESSDASVEGGRSANEIEVDIPDLVPVDWVSDFFSEPSPRTRIGEDQTGPRILLAVRRSSSRAVDAAAGLAVARGAAAVRVVHLRERYPTALGPFYYETVDQAAGLVRAIMQRLHCGDVAPITGVVGGADFRLVAERLVGYAQCWGADLMVVGGPVRGRRLAVLLGATTARIDRLSPCPVMVAGRGEHLGPGKPGSQSRAQPDSRRFR